MAWDPESFVLSAVISSDVTRFEPSTLADQINRNLGIGPEERRLVIGDLDILLDSKGRMRTFEIRSNPARWTQRHLPALPASEPVSAEISASYDENWIARLSLPVQITVDGDTLSLSFGSEAEHWGAIASNAAVGVDQDGQLCEFRFTGTGLRT